MKKIENKRKKRPGMAHLQNANNIWIVQIFNFLQTLVFDKSTEDKEAKI